MPPGLSMPADMTSGPTPPQPSPDLNLPAPAPDLLPVMLTITPQSPEVAIQSTLLLTANLPVTWSTVSGEGIIDDTGLFTAPAKAALVVVRAVSKADPGIVADVTINVQAVLEIVAGGARVGGSADGIGPSARLLGPRSVARDSAGFLYVADTENHTIRRYDPITKLVSTLAGVAGQAGAVDGVGQAARLSRPWGLAYDGADALYVADRGNGLIRKITLSTATVKTIAGVPGTRGSKDGPLAAATFAQPSGLLYRSQMLWVSDSENGNLRVIDLATGTVSTAAGVAGDRNVVNGKLADARFVTPTDLGFTASGVAVLDGSTVRLVDLINGAVATLDDNLEPLSDSVFSLTADGANQLYVCDSSGLRHLVLNGGWSYTVSSTCGNGPLLVPDGIVDLPGNSLRLITFATGATTTLAGLVDPPILDGTGAAARFASPGPVWFDGDHGLYVGDSCTVRHVDLTTGKTVTIVGTPGSMRAQDGPFDKATFWGIQSIATVGSSLLVADDDDLRRIDVAGRQVVTLAHYSETAYVESLATDGTRLWTNMTYQQLVDEVLLDPVSFHPFAGALDQGGLVDDVGDRARFYDPFSLAYTDGGLFVLDTVNRAVRRIDVVTAAVTTVATNVDLLGRIAARDHRVVVSSFSPNAFRIIDLVAGTMINPLPVAPYGAPQPGMLSHAHLGSPDGVAILPTGDIIIGDRGYSYPPELNPSRAGERVILRLRGL